MEIHRSSKPLMMRKTCRSKSDILDNHGNASPEMQVQTITSTTESTCHDVCFQPDVRCTNDCDATMFSWTKLHRLQQSAHKEARKVKSKIKVPICPYLVQGGSWRVIMYK